jgi:hypothetical protein
MAKKNLLNVPQKYYVYYDKKSGNILSVTNETSSKYDYGIELPFEDIEKFISGEWKFQDYTVGYKNPDDKSTLGILNRDHLGYTFKNSMVEWVTTHPKTAVCTVEWDRINSSWNFYLDKEFKKTYNNTILDTQLMFFVTLETDFDFLIRTIFVKIPKLLLENKVSIPFESNIETHIDRISISTKTIFKSYKLKVTNE